MCLAPVTLPNGLQVGCRHCWQCRAQRIEDFVGRCIAESLTASATHVLTLTYGRDETGKVQHMKASKLEYRDVQHMLFRLRKQGFKPRYMVAGEYGGQFGRAHWHIVLNWIGEVPPVPPLETDYQRWEWADQDGVVHDFWPHGFVYVQRPHFKALRYALKYALKSEENKDAENVFGYSSRPPLGDEYFRRLARKLVAQGLAPRDAYYTFSDVRKGKGQLRRFQMRLKTLDNFMNEYVEEWRAKRPLEKFPASPFLEEWQDSQVRYEYRKDNFGRTYNAPPVRGYVTSYQLINGERVWLEKPVRGAGRWKAADPQVISAQARESRLTEESSYARTRIREIKASRRASR